MQRLHLHLYRDSTFTQNKFSEYEFCSLEGIMIHTSYKNVSTNLGNNQLYYDTALSVLLADGYYDLVNLNKILKNLGFYKLILGDGSQEYETWKFTSLTTWNNEDYTGAVNKTAIVKNLTILNQHINNMTFFNGLRFKISAFNEFSTQPGFNQITSTQDVEFPITAPRGTQQWLYFNPPIIFNCDVTNTLEIQAYTWNNQKIEFHPLHEPIIELKFE